MRKWFEIRVREKVGDSGEVKKSKFYFASSSADAASKYKGLGFVISVHKVSREQLLGIGEFFTLGDTLLKEFSLGGSNTLGGSNEKVKEKVEERRGFAKRQKEIKRGYHAES